MNYRLVSNDEFLAHHGIKGQKWGVRRFRNEDGSLTDAGKKRLAKDSKKFAAAYDKYEKSYAKARRRSNKLAKYSKRPLWLMDPETTAIKAKRFQRADKQFAKSLDKAEKLFKEMSKKYSDSVLVDLNPDIVQKGAEVMLMRRYKASSNSYVVDYGATTGNVVTIGDKKND